MDLLTNVIAFITAAAAALVSPVGSPVEHRIERSFEVASGSLVSIDLRGGRIQVKPSDGRTVRIVLVQRVQGASEREAEQARAEATVELTQDGEVVRLRARGPQGVARLWQPRLEMSAEAYVPADVRLSLETRGGSIAVSGLRTAAIDAHTAGGSIRLDGSRGPVVADTAGGSIRVGYAGRSLRAETSGGSIEVARVGAGTTGVALHTSGGSIRVGVDPAARLAIDASTRGGRVQADGLPLTITRRSRTHIVGRLNGGEAPLEASTSGGSVRIAAVE